MMFPKWENPHCSTLDGLHCWSTLLLRFNLSNILRTEARVRGISPWLITSLGDDNFVRVARPKLSVTSTCHVGRSWCLILLIAHVGRSWCLILLIAHVDRSWCLILLIAHVSAKVGPLFDRKFSYKTFFYRAHLLLKQTFQLCLCKTKIEYDANYDHVT